MNPSVDWHHENASQPSCWIIRSCCVVPAGVVGVRIPNRVPEWQKDLNDAELKEVLEQRARDVGRRYRGRLAEYDLNNEMMHADYYQERLGPGVPADMAGWVKSEDPDAVFLVFGRWWSQSDGRTDSEGRLEVSAFYGRHRVSAGGKSVVVELKRSEGRTTIRLGD